jgi:hypothetical protein
LKARLAFDNFGLELDDVYFVEKHRLIFLQSHDNNVFVVVVYYVETLITTIFKVSKVRMLGPDRNEIMSNSQGSIGDAQLTKVRGLILKK